jgi:hypothetical protein
VSSPRCLTVIACGLAALLSLSDAALAQPSPVAPPAAPAEGEQGVEARKTEGQKYFEKGLALSDEGSWDAALAEFLRSRATYPTRAATKNAALCLRKLRRFDEALDMFEELLKFPNLSAEDRQLSERSIGELQGLVGTLVIEAAEPGASLVIDGLYRGTLPLSSPLRIGVGSHEVRAYKEGLDPFGATVEVTGKQQAVVRLRSLSTGGRLKVTEQHGRVLDLVVDGSVVGKTPWEGPVAVGEHLVLLRGNINLDALPECAPSDEGAAAGKPAALRGNIELGTQPVSVPIRLREVTKLTLTAEELDTSIRIEPTPAGASVAIDSVVVGRGTWEGRLRVGAHKVEVTADGFLPETRQVRLERRKRQVLSIELSRNLRSAAWLTPRSVAAGTAYGVGVLGLGVFAVTGGMALSKSNELKRSCAANLCPSGEEGNLSEVRTLGTVSTVGLVVGSIGVVAGTIILIAARPGVSPKRPGAPSAWSRPRDGWAFRAGVGLGRLAIEGRF